MTREHALLNKLVFSRKFLQTVKGLSEEKRSRLFLAGWGANVGYLDLKEVEIFADLTLRQATCGMNLGNAPIKTAFSGSLALIARAGISESEVLKKFVESSSFDDFIDIEAYGRRTSVEEAFFRFCSMELLPHLNCGDVLAVVAHESLISIARQLTSGHLESFAVRHPMFKSTGTGMVALLQGKRVDVGVQTVSDKNISNPSSETTLYFGGPRFVCGTVPDVVVDIVSFATDLAEPDTELRRSLLATAFPESKIRNKLIELAII